MNQWKLWKNLSFLPRREFSLRFILSFLFVLQLLLSVGLIGFLSLRNKERAVENLANQLMSEVGDSIAERLNNYLLTPHIVNQLNENALNAGHLELNDLQAMEQHFWRQNQVFELISYIQFGNKQGEFVGLAVNDDGSLAYQATESTGTLHTYRLDANGNRQERLEVSPKFDARLRPWYIVPYQANKPTWSEIYTWVNPPTLAITLGQPYYDTENQFQGILAADLTISQISDFLRGLSISDSGKTFILERTGNLVATSTDELPFIFSDENPERLRAINSKDVITKATAAYLVDQLGGLRSINSRRQTQFSIKDKQYFLQVTPLQDQHGLDWLSVLVIPESDFMSQINANTQTTLILCLLALALATSLGIYTASWIAQPILRLSKASRAISLGQFNQKLDAKGFTEIGVLQQAFNRMAEKLQTTFSDLEQANLALQNEITERKQAEEKYMHLALHDPVTGFPNRIFLMEHLDRAIKHVQRNPEYLFALLFLDLDRFKVVNDSLGHHVGDQLLGAIATHLHQLIRETDIVARLGGDEFVILLEPIEEISDAAQIADRILQKLSSPIALDNCQVFTSASIGIALSTPDYRQGADMLRDADIAMYRAKNRGKACFEIFNEDMYAQALVRLQLENDLRQSLSKNQLQVFYQPIVDIKTGRLSGFEALARWPHEVRGYIPPSEFIPIAEETGLIVPLGEWVLQTACQQMANWQKVHTSAEHYIMSVNLSIKQLQDPTFLEKIDRILLQTELNSKNLALELTESILMENVFELNVIFHDLKERGIQLSIDDFGTGYSSLSYLHLFPIDTIKIDQSFIHDIGTQEDNQEIIETIVNLAKQLEMNSISEGVESQHQLNYLKSLSCEKAQGYYFSQPQPPDKVEILIINNPQIVETY